MSHYHKKDTALTVKRLGLSFWFKKGHENFTQNSFPVLPISLKTWTHLWSWVRSSTATTCTWGFLRWKVKLRWSVCDLVLMLQDLDVAQREKLSIFSYSSCFYCHKHSLTLGFENIFSEIFFYDSIDYSAINLIAREPKSNVLNYVTTSLLFVNPAWRQVYYLAGRISRKVRWCKERRCRESLSSKAAAGWSHIGNTPIMAAGFRPSKIQYSITSTVKHAKLSRFYADLYLQWLLHRAPLSLMISQLLNALLQTCGDCSIKLHLVAHSVC